MQKPTADQSPVNAGIPYAGYPGWRVLTSDAGRLWATREQPFPYAAQKADAYRTVDADDEGALREVIAEMERRAAEAGTFL